MTKAKSRLKSISQSVSQPTGRTTPPQPRFSPARHRRSPLGKRYLQHLPTLGLGIIGYGGVYYLLTHVYPRQIKNFLLMNTYLPLLIVFFVANLLTLSFVLLDSRRGVLSSSYLTVLLFLKLQKVIITWQLGAGSLLILLAIELILSYWQRLKTNR